MRRPVTIMVFCLLSAMTLSFSVDAEDKIANARAERDELRTQKADAAAELDAAKADDAQVAQALRDITDSVNAQLADLDDLRRQLEIAEGIAAEAGEEVAAADSEREAIEDELGELAVVGFLRSTGDEQSLFFASADPTEATRQASMLQFANTDAADLLEEMRIIIEDRNIAEAIAQAAVDESKLFEFEMEAILDELEDELDAQSTLKAELEARVGSWNEKLSELQQEEDELSQFIREEEAKLAPPPPPNPSAPGTTSASGFQWPVGGRVTSEFGYRVHPIYSTRRLHAGIDLGAPSGTPIVAAKGGTVISAGSRGGYGTTVVISHGGGISTLYAHQSRLAVQTGDVVGRGDVIGYVGSTGNSTGPHLHFEVRVSGTPNNPRGYLP
jgi:murein DD-endopeptidase MepM/ murein hydrolase activator NlpD